MTVDYTYIRSLPGYTRLTAKGAAYVEEVLRSDPARSVGEHSLLSVSGALANPKFRHFKDYESGGCEKDFVRVAVMDDDVVDLFPQPKEIRIVRHDKNGKRRTDEHVADYLLCNTDGFRLVECKRLTKLEELASKYRDWEKLEGGAWAYQPGIEAATEFGMGYEVFFPEKYPRAYLTNLQILSRTPKEDLLSGLPGTLNRVKSRLKDRPHTVAEICGLYDGVTGALLHQAIVCKQIFGLLQTQHFDQNFLLFATDTEAARHEDEIKRLQCQPDAPISPMHLRLMRASPKELEMTLAAKARYDDRRDKGIPLNSTEYREREGLEQARREGAPDVAGFLKKVGDRGGHGRPLPDTAKKEVTDRLKTYFKEGGLPKLSKMCADYEKYAEEQGFRILSKSTYRNFVRQQLAPERLAFHTGGKRAFHAARPMVDGRDANPQINISGLRAHIDGVYGDAKAAPDTEALYARPIFYPLITECGYVLALGVKVGRPSSIAVLMAIRECYTEHGYLPTEMVYDWGPENEALVVKDALAYFCAGYERRPVGAPRFGAAVETFNAAFSAFLQQLPGGMYFDKAGRAADGGKKSGATASMDLAEYIRRAREWVFKVWNKSPIGGSGPTPEELHQESLRIFPTAVVKVVDDLLARYHTSYPLKAKKVDYVRGLRFGGISFHSAELATTLRRQEVPTSPRLDSVDPSMVHVHTNSGLVTLYSLETNRVSGLDRAARMLEQRVLFTYSSTAARNQHKRNVKEAAIIRDAKKVASARKEESALTPEEGSNLEDMLDFSDVLGEELIELGRLE